MTKAIIGPEFNTDLAFKIDGKVTAFKLAMMRQ
jgi:hypothetical protein